ncbi:sigma-S stabilization anti-adapter protein IraP [Klebsiella pneumoniae]|uniref:sigma-S stabilization anti-adapter protein IraP n=1 Tax=Klebsiella pneumoniae TaxID=573 RepID=UPI0039B63D14
MKTQPATGETYPKSDLFNKAVEALEIVVTALLRHMEHDAQQALIQDIEQAIDQVTPCPPVNDHDAMLLQQYLKKLLRHPRS